MSVRPSDDVLGHEIREANKAVKAGRATPDQISMLALVNFGLEHPDCEITSHDSCPCGRLTLARTTCADKGDVALSVEGDEVHFLVLGKQPASPPAKYCPTCSRRSKP